LRLPSSAHVANKGYLEWYLTYLTPSSWYLNVL
jgi:hypothetical protein